MKIKMSLIQCDKCGFKKDSLLIKLNNKCNINGCDGTYYEELPNKANPIEPLVMEKIAERPKIENFFPKGSSLIDVQKEYAKSDIMYKYMTALDRYIDEL